MPNTANLPQPRSILLVGGGEGIGLESTLHLLANSPPSIHLIVFALDINGQLRRHGDTRSRLHLLQGNVTKPADRERAIQLCLDVAGALDCLVYCAGLITPIQRIESLDLNAVRLAYEVNVFGVIAMVSKLSVSRCLLILRISEVSTCPSTSTSVTTAPRHHSVIGL